MTNHIELSDIVLWLRIRSHSSESYNFSWRIAPFRTATRQSPHGEPELLFAFDFQEIVLSRENLEKFLADLHEVGALEGDLSANIAIHFYPAMAAQNFAIPKNLISAIGPYLGEIEISVYSAQGSSND